MKKILALDDGQRLAYFVKTCAASGQVWGLRENGGWCGMGTGDNADAIPFWPEEAFAALMAEEDWADSAPGTIPLDAFLNSWLPDMERDGVFAAIFPVFDATPTGMSALAVSPGHLRVLLTRELAERAGA